MTTGSSVRTTTILTDSTLAGAQKTTELITTFQPRHQIRAWRHRCSGNSLLITQTSIEIRVIRSVSSPMINLLLETRATTRYSWRYRFFKLRTLVALQESGEYIGIDVLRSQSLGISRSSGTSTPCKKTLPTCLSSFFVRGDTRSGLSSAWSRAEYHRQPRDGRATICAISLHINNEFAQGRCIAFHDTRCDGATPRRYRGWRCQRCLLTPNSAVGCAFASTPLLLTPVRSHLWESVSAL